ncbi:Ig domain protein group 2 domain protein [Chengkuizengella sp. YPA3-1-1]|uniref:Ig domain protein group 2 domain protein n=1 Tax=Chengkuizengella marina TaxID=2507566 RepID=A0A6N9Q434_9BACL|nr:Ig domain protein group 2 domain protein [Chengkuizengella marina]
MVILFSLYYDQKYLLGECSMFFQTKKKKWYSVIIIYILLFFPLFANVQSLAEGPNDPAPEIQARGQVNGKSVLFDNTHGQTAGAADWVIDGAFSDFANAIADHGYDVKELRTSSPITYADLSTYDVFVIPEANIPYKVSEQNAMIQYVQEGGSIFFISDHYNADRNKNRWDSSEIFNGYRRGAWENPTKGMSTEEANSTAMENVLNSDWLAEHFGIRFRYNAIGDVTANQIVIPEQSFGITEGVQNVAMHAGSTLAILDPTKAKGIVYLPQTNAAWNYAVDQGVYNNGGLEEGPYAAISKLGLGKAAFIGDSSPVEDSTPKYVREENGQTKTTYDGFLEQDDATLLINIINWLSIQEDYSSFATVAGLELDQPTALLNMEIPQNSTEPEFEPWSQPDAGYNWWDASSFAQGSYGHSTDSIPTDPSIEDGIYFSEYIEGSSYNKALEIYNGSDQDINLSSYKIELSNVSTNISLSGTLQKGDVFVISHSSANQTLLNISDMTTSNLSFNGDDSITLKQNNEIVDVIGVSGTQFAKDTTLIRNEDITSGTTIYNSNEWTPHPNNTFDYIGTHTSVGGGTNTESLFFSEYIEGSSFNKSLEIYNGTGQDIDLSSGYSIQLSNTSTSINLSGILQNEQVFIISHSSADQTLLNVSDMTTSNLSFNGDDSITLKQNNEIIDVIGFMGTQFAKDITLVRNADIISGTTSYNSNEWSSHPNNTFDYIGFH